MDNKKSQRQLDKSLILSVIVVIITIIIGIVFIIAPFVNKRKYLINEVLQEKERNVLIGKIRALNKHLKIYEKRVVTGDRDVSWLLAVVREIASTEKIEISSIEPGQPEDSGLYIKLYVALDTVSPYLQIGQFVSKIESHEKFLRIERIDIKRIDVDKGIAKSTEKFEPFDVKAHIVISTIVLKQ